MDVKNAGPNHIKDLLGVLLLDHIFPTPHVASNSLTYRLMKQVKILTFLWCNGPVDKGHLGKK